MNWFDIIVSLVLLGAFVRGMRIGLAMQLAGLVAIIAGAIFAGKAAHIILPYVLKGGNISTNVAGALSYALAFIIIVISIKFIGKAIHTLFEALHLSFLNKLLGAAMGIVSACLVLSILVNLAIMIDKENDTTANKLKTETFFYSKIQKVAPIIVPYLREEVWEKHIQERLKPRDAGEHKQNSQNARLILS